MSTRQELEDELKILEAERNAQYWTFTRCARGKPVDPKLLRRIYEIDKLLEGLEDDHSEISHAHERDKAHVR